MESYSGAEQPAHCQTDCHRSVVVAIHGGRDGIAMLWDLGEGKRLYSLNANCEIHALCFSPNRYWLCAATNKGVLIWDLESKNVVAELDDHSAASPAPAPGARSCGA